MLTMNQLNPSLKYHTIIGALLGVWAFLFSFFVRPFEHGIMDFQKWVSVSMGYSLLVFLSYLLVSWLQKKVYDRRSSWNLGFEITTYVIFYAIFSLSTYAYYRSPIIRGFYDFPEYLLKIVFNIFWVLTPILVIARRYVQSLIPKKAEQIILTGESKRDRLKIKPSELVCISNAQNYVEIFYLDQHELKKKLIRTSLKQIESDFDFLIRIHRSHLINPEHFKSWKGTNTISLTQIELPVSKNYKKNLQEV